MRFIVDQTQTPNLKVKVAILRYIEALARQMDPADFVNSSETRLAISRIITWTTEPKSSDVRKVGGRGSPGAVQLRLSSHLTVLSASFKLVSMFPFLWRVILTGVSHPPPHPQTLHNWAGEECSGRAGTVASLPGEGNLEERCKQVDCPSAA